MLSSNDPPKKVTFSEGKSEVVLVESSPVAEEVKSPESSQVIQLQADIAAQIKANQDLKNKIDVILRKQNTDDGVGAGQYKWKDTTGTAADQKSGKKF
jgi:hypothetical protein